MLAVFFLGLALGSEGFGRVAGRSEGPLRVFALLEMLLAGLGLLSLPAFGLVDSLFGVLLRALGPDAALLIPARVLLVSAVVLLPAIAMGGSLPLFCSHYVREPGGIGARVAGLYALNTAGAAVGCVAAGFWLLPEVGVRGAVLVAAICNATAGLVVAALHRGPTRPPAPRRPRGQDLRAAGLVGALFFGTGFFTLGSEVLWTRFLALVVPNTIHTYTLTVATTLVGIVIGSALAALVADRLASRALAFGALQVGAALTVTALTLLPVSVWLAIGAGPLPVGALLLAPAVLGGASLPMAVRMVVSEPSLAGIGVGRLGALNTAGGVLGSLLVGFVALPAFGLAASLRLLTAIALAIGLAAWLRLHPARPTRPVVAASAVAAAVWLLLPVALATRIPDDFLGLTGRLVAVREGATSTLSVVFREGRTQLEIDRWWQGEREANHQGFAAHLPMLLHPQPRSVLVVGVGTGQTARRFLLYDIERLDCVDLEPAVFALVREHFDGAWLQDPRVRAISADGRAYLAHTSARYDVISLELGQAFRPGVAGFYTADFYRRARRKLTDEGLLVQFVPLPFFDEDQLRRVVASFLEVFPASQLWYNTAELLLVGHRADRIEVDPARFDLLRTNPAIHLDLARSPLGGEARHLNRREVFLASFLAGPRGLAGVAAGRPSFVDDPPELSYALLPLDRAETRELPLVEILREDLESVEEVLGLELDDGERARVHAVRHENLGEIVASALARRALARKHVLSRAQLRAILEQALAALADHGLSRRLLGDLEVLEGNVAASESNYRRALESRPRDPILRDALGHALLRLGRPAEAAYHYRLSLEIDPANAETHNNLGASLAQQDLLVLARQHFEEALRLRADHEDARRNLRRIDALEDR